MPDPSPALALAGAIDSPGLAALSRLIRTRQVRCEAVMEATLAAIAQLNPAVNALVSLVPAADALAAARAADRDLAEGRWRGPLHGIPMAPKDADDVAGLPSTYGSPLFADHVPAADALFVARMRAAGALFIGRSNVPEFAMGSNTVNPVFGATRNAYDPGVSAGGSSGGAAVALALRLLAAADGSDHAGSLRNPAAWNNVYGFRPSFGVVPADGANGQVAGLATAGPMARSVEDLALLLSVLAGPDPAVPLARSGEPAALVHGLERAVDGLRVGWLGDLDGHLATAPGVLALCQQALSVLADLGCEVAPATLPFAPERLFQAWLPLRFWTNGQWLAPIAADPTRRARMKPEAVWEIEQYERLSAAEVAQAMAEQTALQAALRDLQTRFDVLALPAAQVFAFDPALGWPRQIAGRTMDSYVRWMEVTLLATMGLCPALSVPAGFARAADGAGQAMGLQLIGRRGEDATVLALGHSYDLATAWPRRRPPPALLGRAA